MHKEKFEVCFFYTSLRGNTINNFPWRSIRCVKVQWIAFCVFVDNSIRLIFTMKIHFKGIVTWTGVVCVKLC